MLRPYDTLLSLPHGAAAPLHGALVIATTIRWCVSGTLPVIASVEAASQPTLHPSASSCMEEKDVARDKWGWPRQDAGKWLVLPVGWRSA